MSSQLQSTLHEFQDSYNISKVRIRTFCNWRSVDIKEVKSKLSLELDYDVRIPGRNERIWMAHEPGRQGIPTFWFRLGFQLPMHPLFLEFFRFLGCGVGQMSLNALVQISGFIVRCRELREEPSLEILFSIYQIKRRQLYLNIRKNQVHLVHAPSSNSGYHKQWLYFYGSNLEVLKP